MIIVQNEIIDLLLDPLHRVLVNFMYFSSLILLFRFRGCYWLLYNLCLFRFEQTSLKRLEGIEEALLSSESLLVLQHFI